MSRVTINTVDDVRIKANGRIEWGESAFLSAGNAILLTVKKIPEGVELFGLMASSGSSDVLARARVHSRRLGAANRALRAAKLHFPKEVEWGWSILQSFLSNPPAVVLPPPFETVGVWKRADGNWPEEGANVLTAQQATDGKLRIDHWAHFRPDWAARGDLGPIHSYFIVPPVPGQGTST